MSKRPNNHKPERHIQESGARVKDWNSVGYRVALIYPNSYYQGMSNLGFQTVYHLLNQRNDCLCERFFLPDQEKDTRPHQNLRSLESERLLLDFDLIALSISYENDYLNLPSLFRMANLPLFVADRGAGYPPVLLGGVCAFLNPEPLADIVDLVAVGEAEIILPGLLDMLIGTPFRRETMLPNLAGLPGIYVPSLYQPRYNSSGMLAETLVEEPAPKRVRRRFLADLDSSESRSFVHAEDTAFGNMSLLEVSRGCSRGCRFCAAGYIYLPPRERSVATLLEQVACGLEARDRIGLIAASVADHSGFEALQQGIIDRQGGFSLASLRLDALSAEDARRLVQAGHRSVAIAPEAGSQRMRDFINKGIEEEQILTATGVLAEGGVRNLKLYFMIGFPGEEETDLQAIVELTEKISAIWRETGRVRGRMGELILSVNPFIPKPFSPFQWAGMDTEVRLKKKLRFLHSRIARLANTRMNSESLRSAVLQALLARGDRRVGWLLPILSAGGNPRQVLKKNGLNLDFYITREREPEELFPWEVIDQGVHRNYLHDEYRRARQGLLTPPCHPGCRRCGVCGQE